MILTTSDTRKVFRMATSAINEAIRYTELLPEGEEPDPLYAALTDLDGALCALKNYAELLEIEL